MHRTSRQAAGTICRTKALVAEPDRVIALTWTAEQVLISSHSCGHVAWSAFHLVDTYQYRCARSSYHHAHKATQNRCEISGSLRGKNFMFNQMVRDVMERENALTLTPETTVRMAAELMAKRKTGAVMVVDHERLVGIFTERDALFRVIASGLDARTTRLTEVMTVEPRTVGPNDSYGYALVMMQEGGFRHAPVIESGKPVGIVSSRSALDPELEEFVSEAKRREHIRIGH